MPAQGQGTMNNIVIGTPRWTYYETLGGGQGASRAATGRPACTSGCRTRCNTPIEALELEYPMRVERYELLDGSGGDGRHRGGDGLVRELRVLEPATLSLLTDRRRHAPQGLEGGEPGRPGRNLVNGERGAGEDDARARRRRRRHGRDAGRRRLRENRRMTWVGQPLPRREDLPLLAGRGRFVDDIPVANPLHVAFARSPWAHAETPLGRRLGRARVARGRGRARRRRAPGLTDPFAAGITHELGYYAMAVDRARYAGEAVAAIAAESRYLAEDAAELVVADYEPLDAVVTVEDALDSAKPRAAREVGSNVVVDRTLRYGDPDGAFARADLVVTETLRWERYSSTPIETYGIVADHEPGVRADHDVGELHGADDAVAGAREGAAHARVRAARDRPEGHRRQLRDQVVALPLHGRARAARAARRAAGQVGRGPRRAPDRLEPPARPRRHARAGADEGRRDHRPARDVVDNLGAYVRAPEPATTFRPLGNYVGPYRVQNVELRLRDVVSNKVPTGPNRGYGCHQVYLETERTLDEAAVQLGLDPAEIRRRNLIPADAFPYETPSGGLYD